MSKHFFGKRARQILKVNPGKRKETSTSQQDAMPPSEDDINTITSITTCTRETAIQYLNAKNNNVEQAISSILDGEDLKETWDDSVWMADRDIRPLGSTPEPEQGVIRPDGTTAPIYGPEWSLVKAVIVTPDVEPPERTGAPRFLKPNTDYLPGFLTICHSIPAARNALLAPDYMRRYGSNPDWWKGSSITLARIVHTNDGSPVDPHLARYDDLLAETQRLMAFLDMSTRAYATTIPLERTAALSQHGRSQVSASKTIVHTFVQEMAHALFSVSHNTEMEKLFQLDAISGGEVNHIMEVFDFDGGRSLYTILDDILWSDDDDNYIEKLPEIMVMRFRHHPTAQVKAPGILYMDKYHKDNIEEMRPLRQRFIQNKVRRTKIDDLSKQLRSWKNIDTHALLSQVKDDFPVEDLINNISNTLETLASQRNTIEEQQAELPPLQDHKFNLVGIATKTNITYVLQPTTEPPSDQNDETPKGMQWWRIEYASTSTPSLHRTKVASYDALSAIELEHDTALLVYASDEAMDAEPLPLTAELQDFVNTDNAFFEYELQSVPPPSYAFDVVQSIERNGSSDSLVAHHSPEYDVDPTQHSAYNLGYGPQYDDAPVAEIQLPPDDTMEMSQVENADKRDDS